MNKVWCVITEFNYYGEDDFSVHVFTTYEGAKDYFDEEIRDFYENDHLADSGVIENQVDNFCAYKDGCYSDDHFNVRIIETILDSNE